MLATGYMGQGSWGPVMQRRMEVFGDARHDLAEWFRHGGEDEPFVSRGSASQDLTRAELLAAVTPKPTDFAAR